MLNGVSCCRIRTLCHGGNHISGLEYGAYRDRTDRDGHARLRATAGPDDDARFLAGAESDDERLRLKRIMWTEGSVLVLMIAAWVPFLNSLFPD